MTAAPPLSADAIRQLPAGPELDRLVATLVMNIGWNGGAPIPGYDGRWPWPPPYSTEIEAAWKVVARFAPYVKVDARGDGQGNWGCTIWTAWGEVTEHGKTAPEAICRTALAAAKRIEESQ